MKSPLIRTLLLSLAGASLVSLAGADSILRTNGKRIDDISIIEETLQQVVYKKGGSQKTISSADVLAVTFRRRPNHLEEAAAALSEDDINEALALLDEYVAGQIANPSERRYKWAPAYAAWRVIELRQQMADLGGVVSSSDRFISNFPTSRYLPAVYLAKSSAQSRAGKAPACQATLRQMQILVEPMGENMRWSLECRLAMVRTNVKMSGPDKREALVDISAAAKEKFPTVYSKVKVVEGETYLAQSALTAGGSPELLAEAKKRFERITENPNADAETLAGAFTGLGDCLFLSGAKDDDKALLEQARLHYLRVVVLYPEQTSYVPKALFYAMRCFQLIGGEGDRSRARDMRRELTSRYPGSSWAAESKNY